MPPSTGRWPSWNSSQRCTTPRQLSLGHMFCHPSHEACNHHYSKEAHYFMGIDSLIGISPMGASPLLYGSDSVACLTIHCRGHATNPIQLILSFLGPYLGAMCYGRLFLVRCIYIIKIGSQSQTKVTILPQCTTGKSVSASALVIGIWVSGY